ncbi:MAG: ribonuclease M5 [Kyrpidia sp.]|nr:ribonuclease M5 [Kyrpidia sp.]
MTEKSKPRVAEVVVVEGWRDKAAVDRAVRADVAVTGGTAVSPGLIGFLRRVSRERGVIVFTDPDPMGEWIRRRIAGKVPGCKHAFLSPEEATDGRDVGIEHANPASIARALVAVRTETLDRPWAISWEEMIEAGLAGSGGASDRRANVARRLGIGYGNAKAFWKRVNILGVAREEFWAAVRACEGGTDRG